MVVAVDKLRFARQSIEPGKRSLHQLTPAAVALVADAVFLTNGLHRRLDAVQVAVIQAWKQMMLNLQVESVGQNVPQGAAGTKIVGRFHLLDRPRVSQRWLAGGVAFGKLIGVERRLVQVVDLGKHGKEQARGCHVRHHGNDRRPPAVGGVDPKGQDENHASVQDQVEKQSRGAPRSLPVRPLHHPVERSFLDHAPRNPKAGPKHHKRVRKHDKDAIRLVLVHLGLPKAPVDAQKGGKVVQIRIVLQLVGVAVVRKGVLVLPQDGVAQERHAPHGHVVDPRPPPTGGVMPRIVAQCPHQPTKDGQEKAAEDATL